MNNGAAETECSLVENAELRVERFGFLVWAVALKSCVSLILLGNFGNI